jgi:hypothetical protein
VLYPVAKDPEVGITFLKHLAYQQLLGFPITDMTPDRLRIRLWGSVSWHS